MAPPVDASPPSRRAAARRWRSVRHVAALCLAAPCAIAAGCERGAAVAGPADATPAAAPMSAPMAPSKADALEAALAGMKGTHLGPSCADDVLEVVPLAGRCDQGRTIANVPEAQRSGAQPIGHRPYASTVRLRPTAGPRVRVRSNAVFPSEDVTNVLGTVATGTCVRAEGPLKDAAVPGGVGYALVVRDEAGVLCRGYVAQTMVER